MRTFFIHWFLLIVGSIIPISGLLSIVESGSDLEADDDSGDSISYVTNIPNIPQNADFGHRLSSQELYLFNPNISPWGETEPEVEMLKSNELGKQGYFWENKDIFYVLLSGALMGAIVAIAITVILICKQLKKEKEAFLVYQRNEEEHLGPTGATTVL